MRSRLRWLAKHILGWEPMPPAPPRKVYENIDNLGYSTHVMAGGAGAPPDGIDRRTQRAWIDWVNSL